VRRRASTSTLPAEEKTGQILLVQDGNVTVAADGLNWTNELRISPDGKYLFVNETFALPYHPVRRVGKTVS